MINSALAGHLPTAQAALNTFLETLLGGAYRLHLGEPTSIGPEDVQAAAHRHVAILGLGVAEPFAVLLEPSWVALLSETMLGEPLSAEDSSAKGLVREMAHQAYDVVQSALAQAGVELEAPSLDVRKPGDPLPALAGALRRIPFSLAHGDRTLEGFVVLAASSPAPSGTPPVNDAAPASAPEPSATVAHADFPSLGTENLGGDGDTNLAMLAEVELEVTVELGRRQLSLSDLLRLTKGSVFELEKLVGEPLEVYANGRLIAEGEAVVVDEQFGVRITNLTARP